jgi:branched-chain amino acid transport system substrate-binding protein
LATAQGVVLTEAFYWDLNDVTRAWSRRFAYRMGGGRMPTEDQAGVYAATLAYLRAVRDAGTREALAVVAHLKSAPIDDPLFGHVTIRPDGRAIHPMYLFRAKAPAASTGEWDLYERLDTIPADAAFRPLDQGGCKLPAP